MHIIAKDNKAQHVQRVHHPDGLTSKFFFFFYRSIWLSIETRIVYRWSGKDPSDSYQLWCKSRGRSVGLMVSQLTAPLSALLYGPEHNSSQTTAPEWKVFRTPIKLSGGGKVVYHQNVWADIPKSTSISLVLLTFSKRFCPCTNNLSWTLLDFT